MHSWRAGAQGIEEDADPALTLLELLGRVETRAVEVMGDGAVGRLGVGRLDHGEMAGQGGAR